MNLDYFRDLYFGTIKGRNRDSDLKVADKHINIAYLEVFRAHYWEFRKRTGTLTLVPNYTTGTCTVTKFNGTNESASRTVTFSGSSLTQAMLGRYFQPNGSSFWQKILRIEANTAYLDAPVTDVDGSVSFKIWKRFYYLKSDVDYVLSFDKHSSVKLNYAIDSLPENRINDIAATGDPSNFSPFGSDHFSDIEYSDGTVSIADDSNVLVGTNSPAWLSSGLDVGDIIIIGEDEYAIRRVESDERIVLFNYAPQKISSSTYRGVKNNPVGFQFYPSAEDYQSLTYTYLCHAYPLIHPTRDRILLPREFIPAIVSRSVYFGMNDSDDNRRAAQLGIYTSELEGLRQKVRIIDPPFMQFVPAGISKMPGRG